MHKKSQRNNFVKYSGMAFQMLAVIVIFVFAGNWLDKKFDKSFFILIFSVVGVMLAMFSVIFSIVKEEK